MSCPLTGDPREAVAGVRVCGASSRHCCIYRLSRAQLVSANRSPCGRRRDGSSPLAPASTCQGVQPSSDSEKVLVDRLCVDVRATQCRPARQPLAIKPMLALIASTIRHEHGGVLHSLQAASQMDKENAVDAIFVRRSPNSYPELPVKHLAACPTRPTAQLGRACPT